MNSATTMIILNEECQDEQMVPVNSVKNYNSTQSPGVGLNVRIITANFYSGINGIDPYGRIMLWCKWHETGFIKESPFKSHQTPSLVPPWGACQITLLKIPSNLKGCGGLDYHCVCLFVILCLSFIAHHKGAFSRHFLYRIEYIWLCAVCRNMLSQGGAYPHKPNSPAHCRHPLIILGQ